MHQIHDFVDQRQKSWCIHCGGWIARLKSNRDHVPSKAFLESPYPSKLPTVDVCITCNSSFSTDEEYFVALLGAALAGSTEPSRQSHATAARVFDRNKKLRAAIERSKVEYKTVGGETRVVWKPDASRVIRIVLKNARGHAYFECGEPMLEEPTLVWAMPLTSLTEAERLEFESLQRTELAPLPEVGSRMMTRVLAGQDLVAGWVVVQEGRYRYAVEWGDGIQVKSVVGEYLATQVRWPS